MLGLFLSTWQLIKRRSAPPMVHRRQGVDEVVRLRFGYDAPLIERLKALLAVYQVGTEHKTAGGWLPVVGLWRRKSGMWSAWNYSFSAIASWSGNRERPSP